MRKVLVFFCILLTGCGGASAPAPSKPALFQAQKYPGSSPARIKIAKSDAADTQIAGTDWPCFLGPTGDSVSSERGIVTPWPKDGPPIVWYDEAGEGYGMPVVVKDRLYLFDRVDNTARLRCLGATTGKPLWKLEYPTAYRDKYNYSGGPRCCPVVDDDRVYIFGAEGLLICAQASDGKELWRIDTAEKFGVVQNFFGVGSTPVIEGDLLIAQIGGSPADSNADDFAALKGNGSGVVAFDKFTGKVVYQIADELASYASPVLATIDGRRWCFVLARGGLIGFEPKAGKVDFHFPWRASDLESVNASNPVVVGDEVFISECYGIGGVLLKVKPGGCEVIWSDAKKSPREKSMMCHWMTPIHVDGHLYGCSGRHNSAELRCIELATGKVMWNEPRLSRTSLLMVDGHFVLQMEFGPLMLLKVNPSKFEELSVWRTEPPDAKEALLEYPCWAAPIMSHGLMYLRGRNQIVCVEMIPRKK
jgi:outer membrane protein assembly factor BamB